MLKILQIPLFFALLLQSCKFNPSETKASPEQKEKLRKCIVSTIHEVFPETDGRPEDVRAFAIEFVKSAPSSDPGSKDPAFDAYVNEIGCNPSAKLPSGSFGLSIVEKWIVSPYFKEDIGPGKLSSTEDDERQR